ncbi:hypothetical protein CRG98_039136 [Punica granatum]|uniref:Uncharacterized protein n=1 Tax=Punica granatum TaxID=22663 RepID=A0A2I0I9Z0_PUNGR|nr:hypothetical protein CRG98_039136 [Punica granatum]
MEGKGLEPRLASLTPPSRLLTPTEDPGNLEGGVELADGWFSPLVDWNFEFEISINFGMGLLIYSPDSTSMVSGILRGCMQSWWWGRVYAKNGQKNRFIPSCQILLYIRSTGSCSEAITWDRARISMDGIKADDWLRKDYELTITDDEEGVANIDGQVFSLKEVV